jgi:hypothetical protein
MEESGGSNVWGFLGNSSNPASPVMSQKYAHLLHKKYSFDQSLKKLNLDEFSDELFNEDKTCETNSNSADSTPPSPTTSNLIQLNLPNFIKQKKHSLSE